MTLDTKRDKAMSLAQDAVKQQITLSTGIFALTLTFLKDFAEKNADKTLIEIGWGAFLVSTLCGVVALQCLAGNVESSDTPSIGGTFVKGAAICQSFLFIVGLVFTMLFGVKHARL